MSTASDAKVAPAANADDTRAALIAKSTLAQKILAIVLMIIALSLILWIFIQASPFDVLASQTYKIDKPVAEKGSNGDTLTPETYTMYRIKPFNVLLAIATIAAAVYTVIYYCDIIGFAADAFALPAAKATAKWAKE